VVAFGFIRTSGDAGQTTSTTANTDEPTAIPEIADVLATRRAPDLVEISWRLPDAQQGDVVNVRRTDSAPTEAPISAERSPLPVRVAAGPTACFDVWVVARSRVLSDIEHRCA